ncbi:biotin synthase BioB [Paraclostridium sp. AKS46]|uniref:Biotin synthase n=1 Tax=Paraclostridium bifermentans TaxID=1490 RepID=A0A5P3XAR1_PARBF|nr:biotin synthase BioB [Paraclostridium bifermentans]MCU9807723.1 biotin synthase BioB [Paraclostridium sp. AKS46]QEZ68057.1 biotin synthase BioB [Paraclostridium bifermentans]
MIHKIYKDIKNGYEISKEEAIELLKYETKDLLKYANEIRNFYLKSEFDICSIVNGKSGKCSEDCKFCSQSFNHETNIEIYPLLSKDNLKNDAIYHKKKGVKRYSIVTSGKSLSEKEIDKICEVYKCIVDEVGIETCASHGLLDQNALSKLKKSGVKRYHNNLETSRRYFEKICTTHTYDEKINTIKDAQRVGLEVCSGGIFGLGESELDRIEMAFELRRLNIKSIPLNVLNYIEGTSINIENPITEDEFLKSLAIFRFINPKSYIRLAGGRNLLTDFGRIAFEGGANATITGDLLTTCGNTISNDMEMIKSLGFKL